MCRSISLALACVGLASVAAAQGQSRKAAITGGNDGRGKCTIEVVVDGSAEIEIRSDSAIIRNQSGRQPQWRRFTCTDRMPANPVNFRFSGVDGRGRQELIRDPRNGGAAVVRIEDKEGGVEGYTFDLAWDAGSPGHSPPSFDSSRIPGHQGNTGFGGQPGDGNRRFGTDQAVRACEDAVRQQAEQRFRAADLTFRRTALDEQPDRRDWIVGTFDARRGGQSESYRFSCLVNFDNGQIRSAQIDPPQHNRDAPSSGDSNRHPSQQRQTCEHAISERLQHDGYSQVGFKWASTDTGQRRADLLIGSATARRADRPDTFNFSCSLNNDNKTVRWIDVKRR